MKLQLQEMKTTGINETFNEVLMKLITFVVIIMILMIMAIKLKMSRNVKSSFKKCVEFFFKHVHATFQIVRPDRFNNYARR